MSTDPFVHDDAAYVLGALSPDRRRAFEEHLAGCASCTRAVNDLAGMPGLLARLDESAFTRADEAPPVPETLLPRLLRHVRRRRARERLVAVAAVAALLVLVLVLGVASLLGSRSEGARATAQQMTPVDQSVLSASVAMEQVAWGTRIWLTCTYRDDAAWGTGTAPAYALLVETEDGATEQVATWRAVPGRTTELFAAAAAAREEVTRVDVVLVGTSRRVLTLRADGS